MIDDNGQTSIKGVYVIVDLADIPLLKLATENGKKISDVECVRCSACVVNCPLEVLTFGTLPTRDPENTALLALDQKVLPKSDWRSGL